MPVIDIHTHCVPRLIDDRFGVAAALRGLSAGRNMVTNYRGLPAISYYAMTDFELQQDTLTRAGITGRLISNSFGAETWTEISSASALDIVKFANDQVAELVGRTPGNWGLGTINPLDRSHIVESERGRTPGNWGLGTINPLDRSHIVEGERCLGALGLKGLLVNTSWHGRFIDGEDAFPFWEWAQHTQVPLFLHPPRVPIGHDRQMDQFKLDELVGRPFDTAMALARMILSGLFDRFPRLKIVVAHMGGGLLPVVGRLDFGWRLGCDGLPERAQIRCRRQPSEYLQILHVDTMGLWAPHVRETVDVFGADRVMLGTDYGPVPIDPREHVEIVTALGIPEADKEKILWRNAARFFGLALI